MSLFSKKTKPQSDGRQVVTDTSGLIDGRILPIAKAGFIPPQVIVPRFVVAELQFLADNGDSQKRERARFGLDVIRELQEMRVIEVAIARDDFADIAEVDDKLIAIAKMYGAALYTTDYNLNKVAQIEGISVLNVNELAHALRPSLLPGERIEVKLTQVGQDKTQGVGYMEDGTMIVVEKAAHRLGQRVVVQCTRMIQTQAGKMMFGVLANNPNASGTGKKADDGHSERSGGQQSVGNNKPGKPPVSPNPPAKAANPPVNQPQEPPGSSDGQTQLGANTPNKGKSRSSNGRLSGPRRPNERPKQQPPTGRNGRPPANRRSGRVNAEDRLLRALQG